MPTMIKPTNDKGQVIGRSGRCSGMVMSRMGGIDAIQSRSRTSENDALDERRGNDRQLDSIDQRIDRLTLLCEAMWEVICDAGATPEHLAAKLNELDMADGHQDLKRQKLPTRCDCGAMVPPKSKLCQFCSQPPPQRSFFDPV